MAPVDAAARCQHLLIDHLCLPITAMSDVEQARRDVRQFATCHGFSPHDAEILVLAVSELGMNLVRYADGGELRVEAIAMRDTGDTTRCGIRVRSHDRGPGIRDVEQAMEDGFSTGGGLGSGLPSVRRLMDTFAIDSSPDGTLVKAEKWRTTRS